LIVFAIKNRHLVDVSLWPLDFVVSWPLFVFVYIGGIAGFAGGATVAWLSAAQRHRRARRRSAEKQVKSTETARLKADAKVSTGTGTTSPAVID